MQCVPGETEVHSVCTHRREHQFKHHKGALRNPWHSNTARSPHTPLDAPSALKLPISRLFGNLHGLIWVKYGSKYP